MYSFTLPAAGNPGYRPKPYMVLAIRPDGDREMKTSMCPIRGPFRWIAPERFSTRECYEGWRLRDDFRASIASRILGIREPTAL
jgi:hypothetical protein